MRVLEQISNENQRPILGDLGLQAVQVAGVHPQKNDLTSLEQWSEVYKDLAQSLGIDLAVFQSFVQAGFRFAQKTGRATTLESYGLLLH